MSTPFDKGCDECGLPFSDMEKVVELVVSTFLPDERNVTRERRLRFFGHAECIYAAVGIRSGDPSQI